MTGGGTTAPIRVLVVDDSPTARAVLTELCDNDPAMRVVGQAADGQAAIDMAVRLRPTVILMDITMPGVDGYTATRRIMTDAPTRIVMVTAANDPRSVEVTLRALEAGALTVLAKPLTRLGKDAASTTDGFVSRVKLLAEVGVIRRHAERPIRKEPPPRLEPAVKGSRGILAIATSTGGPPALRGLLRDFPLDFPLPIVVVQHIVAGFIPGLGRWLDATITLNVKVAAAGERLEPGTVYLAPDDSHMTVTKSHAVALDHSPPLRGFRPSGNALLSSVAAVYGQDAIAVVLTGMGKDGLEGATAVSERGGTVLAQDESTSVVYGMPGAVVAAGVADVVGPVESLARRILYLTSRRML